jgi:predicted RNA binding protein YcfA (HicA-like mRNA interferase family)
MSRNPRITGNELIRALQSLGFAVIRTPGESPGEIVGPGLLHKILHDCQVSIEDIGESYSVGISIPTAS